MSSKTSPIPVRFSEVQEEEILKAAKILGIKKSEFVREIALKEARKIIKSHEKKEKEDC